MRPKRFEARDEAGIFLILWTVLVLALLTMIAIVLDLGALRQDRRTNRAAADAAATAGAFTLGSGTPLDACETAWGYLAANLGFNNSGTGSSPCSGGSPTPFSAAACTDATSPSEVTKTVGDWTITIKSPVPKDDALFMQADSVGGNKPQAFDEATDGKSACGRLGVRVQHVRDTTFGKIANIASNRTDVHSVALYRPDNFDLPASLVLLEPEGCDALHTEGSSGVAVVIPSGKLGGMTTDSTGDTCVESKKPPVASGSTLRSDGNQGIIVCNEGTTTGECASPATPVVNPSGIYVNAMNFWPTPRSYGGANAISPTPQAPAKAITRSPVDYKYNCKADYTDTPTGTAPNYEHTKTNVLALAPTLPACKDAPTDTTKELDFINELVRATDPAFSTATKPVPAPAGALNPPAPTLVTNCATEAWSVKKTRDIDCEPPDNTVVNGSAIFRKDIPSTLTVEGNAIFMASMKEAGKSLTVRGSALFEQSWKTSRDLTIGATGTFDATTCGPTATAFIANVASCLANPTTTANLVIARGDLQQQSKVTWTFTNTFMYSKGVIEQLGGGHINWTPPADGPFKNLAFWSETTNRSVLGGGGDVNVRGTFFAPKGTFHLQGTPGMSPRGAQFFGLKLSTGGNALFKLEPNAELVQVPLGPRSVLIR